MQKTRIATVVMSAALAVAGLFAIAPAAWADSCASTTGSRACFQDRGPREWFMLRDTARDGYPVYVVYRYRGGEQREYNYSGPGSVRRIPVNLREGTPILYRACVDTRGPKDRCSGWQRDRA